LASGARLDTTSPARLKNRAAALSLTYNVTLTLLKLAAAILTGSVSLLSEAIHSATDIVSSGIAFFSVRAASAPPDDEHQYGHGKIESFAGFGESILLLLIVGYIAVESIQRLFFLHPVENLDIGVWVMGFSVITSYLTGRYVGKIGNQTHSIALIGNSQHLMVDCITSVGVLVALLVTKLTGWQYADPALALVFAVWMAFGALKLGKRAFDQLVDRRISDEELEKTKQLIESHPGLLGYHRLRTRLGGDTRYIDFHIVVPDEWSLSKAHDTADALEKRIEATLSPAVVVIHVDPYDATKVAGKSSENME